MAVSQSTEKAQNMALCQFCEESTIQWKCINCGLFLCQFCCSKIHRKIKTSQEHSIINLKDCGTKESIAIIQKVDLENMPCTIHSERKCWVYCNDCSDPICAECSTESHKKHEYKKLHEVFDSMISNILAMKDRLETEIQWFKHEKEKLEQLLSDGEGNFQETKNKIIQTKKEMKKVISTYASDLLEELEEEWRPMEIEIKRKLSTLEKNKDELESRERLLDNTLLSHQSSDIFYASQTLDNTLPKKSLRPIQHRKTKFIPGIKFREFNSEMFTKIGDFYTVPALEQNLSYKTDISVVTKIHCDNDDLLIGSWFDEKLQTVIFDDTIDILSVVMEVKIRIYDMAQLQNGNLIISSRNHNLRQYATNGQGKSFKSFSPFKTLGVHVSAKDQILVGLVESHGLTIPTRNSVRRVVVMNQDGFIQHTYEYDSNSRRIFSWPRRITTHNDNIFVVDLKNKTSEGRVVVLDYAGEIQWTYTGCNSLHSNLSKFTPQDIAVSPYGMIVVSDRDNNTVHVLSPTGEVIEHVELKIFGIDIHFSICIDQYESLWIGCNTTTDENKAKIVHLQLI